MMPAKLGTWLLVLTLGLHAPLQCGGSKDPEYRREDTAGDALYGLAEKFKSEGNQSARRATLTYLIERYPSHRFAQNAREELQRSAP
jgi:TolA-binding protein